ncbi:MAG: class I SAM-dependent methyltransferase [Bacteroidetes bacterium]|nr:class I SAM-dependent methyltransferase [Bacteroidota bacterium]
MDIQRGELQQNRNMQAYYRLQSKIYDLTRWSFLFGRKAILRDLPFGRGEAFNLLEVGCGTGYNLRNLARRFPNARFTGMDVSSDMIQLAGKRTSRFRDRVALIQEAYSAEANPMTGKLDVVLFSYSLTMINPQWEMLLERAAADLKPGGWIAVVDFHDSPLTWFREHMSNHHVRMEGHLLPVLSKLFAPAKVRLHWAYGGSWRYIRFVGKKR